MGKYLIKVESMDMDEALCKNYADGIEADGFVIMADQGKTDCVTIHGLSVDEISNIIVHCDELMSAGILAKAKREIFEIGRKGKVKDALSRILGMEK